MDTSIGENEPLTLRHCHWLGLKNENGVLVRKGMKGEVQFYAGIPIANAEIERNRLRNH